MKIILLRKLTTLWCLLILFSFNSSLCAQIIYTDIPDATPNATYPLDLNNDSIVDFLIQFDLGDKLMCKPQNNNAYAGNIVGGQHLPWALSASDNICDTSATWYDSNNAGTMAWGTGIGNWVGATDKYLALKLIVGTTTYYGWARLDLSATSTSFTIKDYAYEHTPNTCIRSGQSLVDIDENLNKKSLFIFPNPIISTARIQTTDKLKNATLTIYNAYGQTLKQVKNISGQTISLSRENLPGGLYFISLKEENKFIGVEKIMIID